MSKIKYAKRDVILHRINASSILVSITADADAQVYAIGKTLLSYLCEKRLDDVSAMPCTLALEIPTWKWAEMGLL